ncbi:hypothetical protein FQ192_19985 [Pseudomonas sp. ANT_J12]|nr:hypothetical protein FQ192_19985 [Pseudomonas sp. ANT_J12]
MIVPTLRVGMHSGTLRVPSRAERGASVEAFPRRAWERSRTLRNPCGNEPVWRGGLPPFGCEAVVNP